MPSLNEVLEFANNFVTLLPPLRGIQAQTEEFWNQLEVNSPLIIENLNDPIYIRDKLASSENAVKQILCLWAGLQPLERGNDGEYLIDYLISNLDDAGIQTVFLINEFLFHKRSDSIETISRLILEPEPYSFVYSSNILPNSQRFCFALLIYFQNPYRLRSVMMFENAERVGYQRYYLSTKIPDIDDEDRITELRQIAEEKIEQGIDLEGIEIGAITDILAEYENSVGNKQSVCFEIFHDTEQEITLIFIFRALRETAIREVGRTLFADEAELIVLRVSDQMRSIDEYSSSRIGKSLATAIVSSILEDVNLEFIPAEEITTRQNLDNLFNALLNESDERIQFREIYLQTAPLDGSPTLIIRSNDSQTLVHPVQFLNQRGIDLLSDYQDIKNIKIGFVINVGKDSQKSYIFKVSLRYLGQNLYYLPYSTAHIATQIRANFESHLGENYSVRVFPGKG